MMLTISAASTPSRRPVRAPLEKPPGSIAAWGSRCRDEGARAHEARMQGRLSKALYRWLRNRSSDAEPAGRFDGCRSGLDGRAVPDARGDDHVQAEQGQSLEPVALAVEHDDRRQNGRQQHGTEKQRAQD